MCGEIGWDANDSDDDTNTRTALMMTLECGGGKKKVATRFGTLARMMVGEMKIMTEKIEMTNYELDSTTEQEV